MKFILPAALISLAVPAAAQAETFDGPQVGVTVGYNHDAIEPGISGIPTTQTIERDSLMVGIFAGYDKTIAKHIVIGAEASLNGPADNKLHDNRGIAPITVDPRLAVYLSARAGYLIDDKTLLYVRGGCVSIRVHSDAGQTVLNSSDLDGWHAGAGLEHAIGNHANIRIEYRFTEVGRGGSNYQRQQALVGVAYRF